MTKPTQPAELLREYASKAVMWDALVGSDAKAANPIFDRLHQIAKELRTSPQGRSGLERLAHHEVAGVRLLAASDCLPFAPEVGEPVLADLESFPGLHAISAEYTLKAFRAGTLKLDW